jgi:hypothetical protein
VAGLDVDVVAVKHEPKTAKLLHHFQ